MLETPFAFLKGKTLSSIVINESKDEMTLKARDGAEYRMHHSQDCCENVRVEEIVGELGDILESPILEAEEVSSPQGDPAPEYPDSWTWTFYKLGTAKGFVTIRWLGESNGYYSERVDFVQTKQADQ